MNRKNKYYINAINIEQDHGNFKWKRIVRMILSSLATKIYRNLHEIDLSNTSSVIAGTMLSVHCPHLEKITWHNSTNDSLDLLGGHGISPSNNIKEIIMNDSSFYSTQLEIDNMSDLETHRDTFIFHCS